MRGLPFWLNRRRNGDYLLCWLLYGGSRHLTRTQGYRSSLQPPSQVGPLLSWRLSSCKKGNKCLASWPLSSPKLYFQLSRLSAHLAEAEFWFSTHLPQ
ncbi:hypothetical protein AAFF_G00177260 [Aldrovandia affinis]|uniref:Uncharacterized protein n=1 Tax=Aldrovandia affinis TaxID=143900 RepID=A0AAD7W6X3_9TELE|nr:hypothetical protein AAFF_G00177260 [Aldrovandia affinis]